MIPDDLRRLDRHRRQSRREGDKEILKTGVAGNDASQRIDELIEFFELSPVGYLKLDKGGRIRSANLTACYLLKCSRARLIGQILYRFVVHNDRDTLYLHLRHLFEKKRPQICELQVDGRNGKPRWVRLDSVYDESAPQHPLALTVLIDIDDQKQIQTELERLAAMVQFSEDAIIRQSLDGVITHWNPAAEKIYGYSAAEVVGRHVGLIIPQARAEENHQLIRRALRGEQISAWETVRRTKDGRIIDISLSVSAIRDERGETTAIVTIERDVTEHVATRRRLNRIREELQMATAAAQIGTWFSDLHRGISQWNDQLYRLLGLKPRPGPEDSEFFFSFIHPEDRRGWLENSRAMIEKGGNEIQDEFRIIRNDGRIRWLAVRGQIMRNAAGEPVQIAGVNFDITEIKQAQEAEQWAQMQLAAKVVQLEQKNQELDQFVYAASHDLKAPLRAILNYSEFLYEDLAEDLDSEQKRYLEGLKTAAGEGQQLIDDLLAYSRIGRAATKSERIDMPALIKELKSFLNLSSEIEVRVVNDWPVFEADPLLLSQIMKNLVSNAVKFNSARTKRVEIGWRRSEKDGCIELFVRDNGIGIDPQYQQQIFGIFQRLHTSKEYEGTGIGLAIVKKAALEMEGAVRVASIPGEGSTFYVEIPRKMEAGMVGS
jgi:PAS domain S-box-containing protein